MFFFTRWLETLFLVVLLSVTLIGCALVQEFDPPKFVAPPVVETKPKSSPARELGSLWSETSSWNEIYSVSVARSVGDLVIVRFEEPLKQSLKARVDELFKVEAPEPEDPPQEDENGKRIVKAPAPAAKKETFDASLRATIREVHPRGIYTIVAADTLRVGTHEPYVYLEGQIRDRDIAADETISSGSIQGLRFDVYPVSPQRIAAGTGTGNGNTP